VTVSQFIKKQLSWNPKVRCNFHKGPSLDNIRNTTSLRCILILFLCTSSTLKCRKWSFPSGFRLGSCVYFYPMHATCSAYLIVLDIVTIMFFGEECKLLTSSLCICLHPVMVQISSALHAHSSDWMIGRSNPGRGWEFFSSLPRLEWLWDPPSLLSNGYQGFFPGGKAAGV
jgi:hypothetical protein